MLDSFAALAAESWNQDQALNQTLEPLIQNYYSLIYQSLLHREAIFYANSATQCTKISRYTFWQFSKLPKFVSDGLFAAVMAEMPGSFTHFLEIFKVLAIGSDQEQSALIFGIIDRDGDGLISQQDCHALLNHSIAHPGLFRAQEIPSSQNDIKTLLSSLYNSQNSKISASEFQQLKEKEANPLFDKLISYLQNHFRIKQKVRNYQITNPQLAKFPLSIQCHHSMPLHKQISEEEEGTQSRRVSIREEDKDCISTIESEYEGVIMEGSLYRMVGPADLKRYYARLINTEIYLYKNKLDDCVQEIIVLGPQDTTLLQESNFITETDLNLYTVVIQQPHTDQILYFLQKKVSELWRRSIAKIFGKEGIFLQKYKMGVEIGQGQFGQVRVALSKEGRELAVKILSKERLSYKKRKMVRQEIEIQGMCKHASLLGLEEVFEDRYHVYMVQKLMRRGSLEDYLSTHKTMDYLCVLGIAKQIAKGLEYLSNFRIVHRDIKPKNILLTGRMCKKYDNTQKRTYSYPEVKIADYGLSLILSRTETSEEASGTLLYAAPQLLHGKAYNEKIDIYSLGVIMYQLLCGRMPFYHEDYNTLYKMIQKEEASFASTLFIGVPLDILELVKSMMRREAESRIGAESVIGRIQEITEQDGQ